MVSLKKNQTISLKKESSALNQLHFGLGWDPVRRNNQAKKGFLSNLFSSQAFSSQADSIDLDASCIMLDVTGKKIDEVWFGNLESKCLSVLHSGDNLTGEGDGDDEIIYVNLPKLPFDVEYLVFTVNSFRGQTFDEVDNAFCRVLDQNNKELAHYKLSEQGSHTGIIIATLKRNGGLWDFTAQGFPCSGRTIHDMYPQIVDKVIGR